MQLYSFFRSGTSHRLRIALNLKGLETQYLPVDLRKEAHFSEEFRKINPQGFVPALIVGDEVLTQTPAIIEWLEETYPTPALIPADSKQRIYVRTLAAIIACDMHPLSNRRVLERLRKEMGQDEKAINEWCQTWIIDGFNAFESQLSRHAYFGDFCCGAAPTIADVYLIAQVETAMRFNVDLSVWPIISKINQHCLQLPEFQLAKPSAQPDAS
jgi:maleylpyruvate isomerase